LQPAEKHDTGVWRDAEVRGHIAAPRGMAFVFTFE